jgi:hypothetical protein
MPTDVIEVAEVSGSLAVVVRKASATYYCIRYQSAVLLSYTNWRALDAGMTSETPSCTWLVPLAAKVTENAVSTITVTRWPLNVPACMMMPVTAPVGATRLTVIPAVLMVPLVASTGAVALVTSIGSMTPLTMFPPVMVVAV